MKADPISLDSRPRLPRRGLMIQGAGLAAAALGFPAITRSRSPNSKLAVALIGVGRRGRRHLMTVAEAGENIVALCDLEPAHLEAAREFAPEARHYRDFRELHGRLEGVDAVVVSTTEHTHAHATLPLLRADKHVFLEKPLTRDVHECRVLVEEAARRPGVMTQMGIQIHAGENYRRVVERIEDGVIGPVREVHVWVSRAWGHQTAAEAEANKDILHTPDTPAEAMPVPEGLDWDLWIGPAPYRPFHEWYYPGPRWYRWWDFANGTMSDLGSHWNDLPFWALGLDAPLTVEAGGPHPAHHDIAPASMWARYTYGERGPGRPPVALTWYQGSEKPPLWSRGEIPQWPNGHLFIGDEGMLLSDYSKHVLLPEERFAGYTPPPDRIPPSPGQMEEWLLACKGEGPEPLSHFGYSGPLTEANHLGNVAFRAGAKLEWDAAAMKIPNHPAAEGFLARDYREGWPLQA